MDITGMTYQVDKSGGLYLVVRRGGSDQVIPAPIRPYFFVLSEHTRVAEYYMRRRGLVPRIEQTDYKTLDGKPVARVEVEYPKQVSMLRDLMPIPTFEADIPFVRRVCIDLDWKTSSRYEKLYYDVEVKDGRIIAIGVAGERGSPEVLTGGEKEILEQFIAFVMQSDLLIGYNSESFDRPVILDALRRCRISLPPLQRWYDLLQSIRWISQRMLPSWSLDEVAKYYLGERRVHTDKPFAQLTMAEIVERCSRDVELTRALDQKLSASDVDIMKAHMSYTFPDETINISTCIDALLLKKARELGYVLPNKPVSPNRVKHSGAFVAQPPKPLYIFENVLFLDFVSLYPNIIIGFKISPDPDGALYPELLRQLFMLRRHHKELYRKTGEYRHYILQQALKTFLNAFYGCFNAIGFRIQREDLGDKVASTGRMITTSMMKFYQDAGCQVIYADTDSVAISGVKPDERVFQELAEVGCEYTKKTFGVDELIIEPKEFYSKLYFPKRAGDQNAAKKKYAGLLLWDADKGWREKPELVLVGLEYVRSDFPEIAKVVQRDLIEMFLGGASIDEIRDYLQVVKEMLYSGQIDPAMLAWSRSITKAQYKADPPHVKAARKLEAMLGVKLNIGDKVRFVKTKMGVQPIELLTPEDEIDFKYYWQSVLAPLVERCLGIVDKDAGDRLVEVSLDSWMQLD